MAFDMDWNKNLRILTGMNPAGAQYHLQKGEKFTTPPIVWAYSKNGKGDISRKFHRWSTDHVIRDPQKNRPVLLNNWEATHCDFDEKKLTSLFDGAQQVGAELFLLDDGWFGNDEFSRDDDKRGLGDWQVSRKKLPNGFPHLVKEANKRGIDFGIWIEPEMVNPNSELYQQHPDWIITQPKREPILGRYQEILDLTRPEVQAFEWNVINDILHPNPDIAYVKWDCNRYVTQPGSNYLSPGEQSHLLINYNRELLKLMERFATNFPNVMAMICSGGGGRVDFGSLRYFHSFWPSDNTDPIQRVKIQWGFSHFFPASTISSHVTRMGKAKMKFAIDVALSGAFGVDLALDNATPEEREQIAEGVRIYKSTIRNLVMSGELYRLLSPYGSSTSSLSYVSQNKDQAILYIYQIEDGHVPTIPLSGLAKDKNYLIREINIPDGTISKFPANGKKFSGVELMEKGIENPLSVKYESAVLELSVVN
jgi:alpha-galactosidase